jgi:hypothetical protein
MITQRGLVRVDALCLPAALITTKKTKAAQLVVPELYGDLSNRT